MRNIHCYTSVSFSYLDRARVLAETIRKHHPDWTIWLLLSDEPPEGFRFDVRDEQFDYAVYVSELGIDNWKQWIFGHDVVELCTAVKGPMLCRLLDEGADAVIYLDPDTALFAPLDDVVERLDSSSVVLTPHLIERESTLTGVRDNEIGSLKHGVYNLGFVAVRNDKNGKEFAEWWRDRLLMFCHDDVPNGLFTDQRWCDLVPALFDSVNVLRNPGYNVASWNLATRPIGLHRDGSITAGPVPLRFFHFTKVSGPGEAMLERYSFGSSEVFELLRWYRGRLAYHHPENLPANWWKYGRYSDGTGVPRAHRLIWRERTDLHASFPDPFAAAEDGFNQWCVRNGYR